jgi:hypothetical protein
MDCMATAMFLTPVRNVTERGASTRARAQNARARAERARASMPTRGCAAVVGAFRELGRFGGARAAQWRRGSRAIDCFYSITSTLYELEARPRRMA